MRRPDDIDMLAIAVLLGWLSIPALIIYGIILWIFL